MTSYKVECGEASEDNIQITQTMLENTHVYDKNPIELTVNDALIPVMTGYDTPSGHVTEQNSAASHVVGWQAFNPSTIGWVGNRGTESGSVWLGYEFPSNVIVKAIEYNPRHDSNNGTGSKLRLVASEDGTTFDKLLWSTTSGHTTNEVKRYNFDNNIAYKYYRIICESSSGNNKINAALKSVQFYKK